MKNGSIIFSTGPVNTAPITYWTITTAGILSASNGVTLQTTGLKFTVDSTTLTGYAELTSLFDFTGPWTGTGAVVMAFTQIGNTVSMRVGPLAVEDVSVTVTVISSSTAIVSDYRPAVKSSWPIIILFNVSGVREYPGYMTIDPANGIINLRPLPPAPAGDGFTVVDSEMDYSQVGWNAISVSYIM